MFWRGKVIIVNCMVLFGVTFMVIMIETPGKALTNVTSYGKGRGRERRVCHRGAMGGGRAKSRTCKLASQQVMPKNENSRNM